MVSLFAREKHPVVHARKIQASRRSRGTNAEARDLFAQALVEAQEHEDAEASPFPLAPGNAKTLPHSPTPGRPPRVRAANRQRPGRGFADPGEEIERPVEGACVSASAGLRPPMSEGVRPNECAASVPRKPLLPMKRAAPAGPRHACDTAWPRSDRNGRCRSAR